MDDTVLKIALAGLLHDIGKFMQRAGVPLSNYSEGLEGTLCKSNQGHYSHKHVLWTNEFFEMFSSHPLLGNDFNADSIANLASYHHNPSSNLQEIIQLADCLSSASDRMEEDEDHGRNAYKKERLHSVFEYVSIKDHGDGKRLHRYELKPLDNSAQNLFPVKMADLRPPNGDNLSDAYSKLWFAFKNEVQSVSAESLESYIAPIMSLLEKYTWCIPSTTIERPDISLYDHGRTTAAIAASLYLYMRGRQIQITPKFNSTIPAFILVVGDISGIQNYIYDIKNVGAGGAAKRLRARSFFISALSDVAAFKFLRAFGLPLTNIIMGSGGKFYLLLPNTEDALIKIGDLSRELNEWLVERFHGELGVNVGAITFSCKEFGEFNLVLKRANEALRKEKTMPFRTILQTEAGWQESAFVFQDVSFTNEESLCQACGRLPGSLHDEVVMCEYCNMDVQLGRQLANAHEISYFLGGDGRFPIFDDFSFSVSDTPTRNKKGLYLKWILNDWNLSDRDGPVRSRYFANHVPLFTNITCNQCDASQCTDRESAGIDNPRFFTCLAQSASGRKLLGVLKGDLDNLGLIFIKGFREAKEHSISRISTLSRMLESFFTGRVDALLRSKFNDIYTVYAGGDDVLLLGPWDVVLEFAGAVQSELQNFTCNNMNFTISAGMALARPRLPILSIVDSANGLLDQAKKEKSLDADNPKNQFAVFGDHFKWTMFGALKEEGEHLASWLKNGSGGISMSTARRLLFSADLYKKYMETGDARSLCFIPLLAYTITRNIDARETEIVRWLQDLMDLNNEKLKYLHYVTNFAITTYRS